MGTFMTAYLAVWLAVVFYVGWLGLKQRRLQRSLDSLEQRARDEAQARQPPAKAA